MEEKYYRVRKYIELVVLSVNAGFAGGRNISSVLLWATAAAAQCKYRARSLCAPLEYGFLLALVWWMGGLPLLYKL